jgi:hypothetical protein
VAKQVELNGRSYWILSEPDGGDWRAWVTETLADGRTDDLGIDATGETRSQADELAERKLRRILKAPL